LNPVIKIILLNISEIDYPYFILSFSFSEFLCPFCGSPVKYHASYEKNLYAKAIDIHRVRCSNSECRHTHAIIPSFSVPGCSIGTKELNFFIKAIGRGKTIEEAGQCFIDAGMSPDYPESIHRRLKRYRSRIETIFAPLIILFTGYFQLILHLTDNNIDPVSKLHQLCYERKFNPVLFSRINILIFPDNNSTYRFSLNPTFRVPP
jgi:hypothetical protein